MTTQNKQLEAWTGDFGNDYTDRNMFDEANINNRMQFWAKVFNTLPVMPLSHPKDILEVGANSGANLIALDALYKIHHNSDITMHALEPNHKAKKILQQQDIRKLSIAEGHACDIGRPNSSMDIVLTCGVLIHVPPEDLQKAMGEIYRVSKRFIICAEYFSPEPREIPYRGTTDLLFTRDFGGAYVDGFPGLRCVDYGFAWKRFTGMDNLTWWVFEKVN